MTSKKVIHMILQMLGAILSTPSILGSFYAKVFTDFAQISTYFARIFTKLKILGVYLHPWRPRLLSY